MFNLIILFSTVLVFASQSALAIVGGENAKPSDKFAGSVVALLTTNGQVDERGQPLTGLCTGTILNSEYILTAAHCVVDMRSGVVVFDQNLDAHIPQNHLRKIVDARFNLDYPLVPVLEHNDVALVKFAGGLPEGYFPAKILDPRVSLQYLKMGSPILIAGYGTTGPNDRGDQSVLRKLRTTVRGVGDKKESVVIGTEWEGACHGDSGGPAFVEKNGEFYLWGVTSRGYKADCTSLSVYTRLASNFYGKPYRP